MRITCPKCQFKGLIDTAPLAFEARVACVRCGIVFDALLLADGIQTSLPPDDSENSNAQAIVPDSAAQAEVPALDAEVPALDAEFPVLDAEDVLALPQAPDADYQTVEPAPVLEDVLPLLSADVDSETQENVFASQTEETAEASAVVTEEDEAQSPVEPPPVEIAAETAHEPTFTFDRPAAESLADYRQSMGMRLMRISPLWLLVCGLTFVSVIVLSNQFAKPANQPQPPTANSTSPSNKATNQSLNQPLAPAATNSASTSAQDTSQMSAPAPVEVKKSEAQATEEKDETKAQNEQQAVAPPKIVPVVETEVEPVKPALQSDDRTAGGLTIQVGSYNVIEQANERVARLQAAGFDARVVAVELPRRGTWYRVQAGLFGSREEAARYGQELKAKGAADNFIITEAQSVK